MKGLSVAAVVALLCVCPAGQSGAGAVSPGQSRSTEPRPPRPVRPEEKIGFWRPSLFAAPDPEPLTPAEVKRMYDRLKQISDVFRETPVLKALVGIEAYAIHSVNGGLDRADARISPPRAGLTILIFQYWQMCPDCPIKPEGEAGHAIYLGFNPTIGSLKHRYTHTDDVAVGTIYGQPRRLGDLAGFPIYESDGEGMVLIIKDLTRQVWIPVSQEQWLRSRISDVRRSIDGDQRMVDRVAAARSMEDDLARLRSFQAELAALSPAERSAPAYRGAETQKRPSGLTSSTDPRAEALVVINADFYDTTRPRTSVQMAVLTTSQGYGPSLMRTPTAAGSNRVLDVLRTVDWKRILSLFD
jgi:hypothetical protein